MAPLLSSIFLLLGVCSITQSKSLVHYGAPPPGYVHIKLETFPPDPKIHLAGTVTPPTLAINGNPIKLTTTPHSKDTELTGVYIDQKTIQTSGKLGRFFVKLTPEDLLTPKKIIIIRTATSDHQASVDLKSVFLDAPIRIQKTIRESKLKNGSFFLKAEGPKNKDYVIALDGFSLSSNSTQWQMSGTVPQGRSYIYGTVTSKDGSVRALALPVNLEIIRSQKNELYFSVQPMGKEPSKYDIPVGGGNIKGVVSPGAKLEIDGDKVDTKPDGSFSYHLLPYRKEWEVEAEISLGKTEKEIDLELFCSTCDWSWYAPRHRRPWDFSFFFRTPFSYNIIFLTSIPIPQAQNVTSFQKRYPTNPPNLGLGLYLSHNFELTLEAKGFDGFFDIEEGGIIYSLGALNSGVLVINHYLTPFFYVGVGFAYLSGFFNVFAATGPNSPIIDGLNKFVFSFGAVVQTGIRLSLGHHWEITTQLLIKPRLFNILSDKSNVSINFVELQPLTFRYFF